MSESVKLDRGVLEKVLQTCLFAPSGDNAQPWQLYVEAHKQAWRVTITGREDLAPFNINNGATMLAIGGLIENIYQACTHHGWNCHVETQKTERIRIEIDDCGQVDKASLFTAIPFRHTNRQEFGKSKLTAGQEAKLRQAGAAFEGISVYLNENDAVIRTLSASLSENEGSIMDVQSICDYVLQTIRFGDDPAVDGMPIKTLTLKWGEQAFFKLLIAGGWGLVKALNRLFAFSRIFRLINEKKINTSSVLLMLTVKGKLDAQGLLQCGRALQRTWLQATQIGLMVQPIGGLPLLINLIRDTPAKVAMNERVRLRLLRAETKIRSLFGVRADEQLGMGFRMGAARSLIGRKGCFTGRRLELLTFAEASVLKTAVRTTRKISKKTPPPIAS